LRLPGFIALVNPCPADAERLGVLRRAEALGFHFRARQAVFIEGAGRSRAGEGTEEKLSDRLTA
jgi:hypothetical protein